MCIVQRVADSWTLFGDSFEQKWMSIENGSSKLTHSLFIAPLKTTFIRNELAYADSDQGLLFFVWDNIVF